MPKISIIVPLYNKERFIKKTISSVLEQSFSDFELIIVNDGSTDCSLDEVHTFDDARIVVVNKDNGGVSSARNAGILRANTDWLFFLDADDVLQEDCLRVLYELHERHVDADICCGNFIMQYPNIACECYCKEKKECVVQNNFKDFYNQRFFLRTGIFIVRRDVLDKTGLFDENLSLFEDLELFFKMMRVCKIVYTPDCVFIYEKMGSELSRKIASRSSAYRVNLDNTSHYEKKLYTKILIDEMITARRDKRLILQLVAEQKKHLIYIIFHFFPCLLTSLNNACFWQRVTRRFFAK